jgi:SAM-dependent methyltransferase
MVLSAGSPDAGDFIDQGQRFLSHFRLIGGLERHHRVLEIGCGAGRIARALAGYLEEGGSYEGLDLSAGSITWCQKNITPNFPYFRFHHADLFNGTYNPTGRVNPEEFGFPFAKHCFDFAILTSVFTHMLPKTMEHYVAELARVLRPGGRTFATFFLLNDVQEMAARVSRNAGFVFPTSEPGAANSVAVPEHPEDIVGYDEFFVRNTFRNHGHRVIEPISFGSWNGRQRYVSLQDIVVSEKE